MMPPSPPPPPPPHKKKKKKACIWWSIFRWAFVGKSNAAKDGSILAWKFNTVSNCFRPAASLKGGVHCHDRRTNLLRMRDARFVGVFHPLIDEKLHRSSYIIIDLSRRVCLGIICGAYSSKKSNQSFFALRITLVQFIYLFTISRGVHVVESISLLCEVGVFALYISINGSNPIKAITRMISSNSSAAATYCPGRRQRLFVIAVDCYDQNGNGTQTFQEIISSVKKATSLGFGQGRVGFVLLTGSSLQETLKAFKGCQVSIEEFDASARLQCPLWLGFGVLHRNVKK